MSTCVSEFSTDFKHVKIDRKFEMTLTYVLMLVYMIYIVLMMAKVVF